MKLLKIITAFALVVAPLTANAAPLQKYQPGPRLIDGTQLNKMVDVVNNLTGNGTAQPGTFTSLTATSETITSTSANALAVGRQGTTNPVLKIDASTASVATGLQIKGAAAAGGLALSTISSGTDENLTLDAKGAGTITLNGTGTGNIVLARAAVMQGQLTTTFGTPTIGSGACGATNNGVITSGTNQAGLVTIGAAATTTCTISFSATLASAPNACVVFPASAGAAATGTTVARVSSISTANFVITGSALASTAYYYLCI